MKAVAKLILVLLSLFTVLAVGAVLLVDYGSVRPQSQSFLFLKGYGLTTIPCRSENRLYPQGDLMVVQRLGEQGAAVGDAVLYVSQAPGVASGFVQAKADGGYTLSAPNGQPVEVQPNLVFARYWKRIPYVADAAAVLKMPLVLTVYALAFIAAVLLYRLACIRLELRDQQALSPQDEEIETFLD